MLEKRHLSWNLSDLYLNTKDDNIKKDLEKYKTLNQNLAKNYKGKLSTLSAEEFYKAIKICEETSIIAHVLGAFAYLNMSTQMNNKEATMFYQDISEKLTEYSKPSIFFSLELNSLSEDKISEFLNNSEVAKFEPWIKQIRIFKKHELSEEVEEIFLEKDVTSNSAWVRLYDEHSVDLKYIVDGKEYNDAEISLLTQHSDIKIRHKAGAEINRVCKENSSLFTFIYNMIIKDKSIEDEKRGFKHPISSQNLRNKVDDEVVNVLANSVRENYSKIAFRFYKLKAKWLGVEKLSYWDRNAPLPFEEDAKYSWDDSVKMVLGAYKNFSPKLYDLALDFFDKDWIDVYPQKGKRSGAFAHPVSASKHPYLFLNFTGKQRDVLTLAHELGHGCHMRLSLQQGELQDDTPLTLSEVASVFAESLTFKKMIDETTNDKVKLCLIASKVSDMINTAIRQIAFHCFEKRAHDERKNGELSALRLTEIWQEEMRASLGDYVKVDEDSEYIWSQVSHFFHLPFYVYAYSFADCVVNSLFGVYQLGNIENFEDKYLQLLSQTGVKKYDELLTPFGLDAKDKDFWQSGLGVISSYIDELERLDKKINF